MRVKNHALRCEFCGEVVKKKWCETCKKRVAGYYQDDPNRMPPKTNQQACVELMKSMVKLRELKGGKPMKRTVPPLELVCAVCREPYQVPGGYRGKPVQTCGKAECAKTLRQLHNARNRRAKQERMAANGSKSTTYSRVVRS